MDAIKQVIILVLIMGVGFLAARIKIINADTRSRLSELLLLICTPMQVLVSFQMDYTAELAVQLGVLAVIGTVAFGMAAGMGALLWRKKEDSRRRVLWFATMCSNCGFMGIPVLKGVFGDVGVMYASIFVLIFTVYNWTLGVYIMGVKGSSWKNIVLQPGLLACVAGVALFFTRVRLPDVLNQVLESVGNMTTPLAMIVIGSLIAEMDMKGMFGDGDVWWAMLVRLIVLPGLTCLVLKLLGLPHTLVKASVLIMGMPIATNTVLFATRYDRAPHLAGSLVVSSTIFSMGTLALWMAIL
ncbi:MAG: AEC family transporter [Eubacteriales bacterium]|nr:AEC family transporter [Eubacteriales bacterium]